MTSSSPIPPTSPTPTPPTPATVHFDDLPEALAWLDTHINFEQNMPTRREVPTLDRMRELMGILGDPQSAYPSIHLTGTNGKGSTAAMATALLGSMGLSVGTYTSPNLSRVNERIARNGEPIDDDAFREVLETLARVEPLVGEPLTRFELLTAAGLMWFADEAVDVAVVEVGLGGRWDCTNVVDATVAVITNVSFDHTEVLGPTLEDIAGDKAGIFKEGSRVIIGETDPHLASLLRERAELAGASETWVRLQDFGCSANRVAVGGRLVDMWTPAGSYGEVLVPLHGAHQGDNAACALAAVEAFFGSPLDEEVVEGAFAQVRVPGRLEILKRHPLVVIDGAHNVAGMIMLARALVEEFTVDGDAVAVVGMLSGRDPLAMLDALVSAGIRSVVVCAPDSPRALSTEVVGEAALALGMATTVADSPSEAVTMAIEQAGGDGRVVVCGSLYVVADARRLLLPEGA
ncbi:MAG TPA: folylpolyglutamate synthase/dihydrofolate synthase family protein [Acidimicrobiales bacterium]|nr:folylpolyglutamate synthase/dihydrofolate synthase family protein [Acidimicrobiales bacterium]